MSSRPSRTMGPLWSYGFWDLPFSSRRICTTVLSVWFTWLGYSFHLCSMLTGSCPCQWYSWCRSTPMNSLLSTGWKYQKSRTCNSSRNTRTTLWSRWKGPFSSWLCTIWTWPCSSCVLAVCTTWIWARSKVTSVLSLLKNWIQPNQALSGRYCSSHWSAFKTWSSSCSFWTGRRSLTTLRILGLWFSSFSIRRQSTSIGKRAGCSSSSSPSSSGPSSPQRLQPFSHLLLVISHPWQHFGSYGTYLLRSFFFWQR